MAKQISGLTTNPSPARTDVVMCENAAGTVTYKDTKAALLGLVDIAADINAELAAFTAAIQGITLAPPLQSVDVELTSANILALHSTPITLVAAPGADAALVFERATFFLDYASVAYADIAEEDDLNIHYADGSGAIAGTLETTGFLNATSDDYAFVVANAGTVLPVVNAPLVASLAGAVTTGDSPIGVRVYYRVIDLSTLEAS